MKAFVLSDSEFATEQLEELDAAVGRYLEERGYEVTKKRLGSKELGYCRGCFGCWIRTPGECVIRDAMEDINRRTAAADTVVYLVPVVFGAVFRQHEKRD